MQGFFFFLPANETLEVLRVVSTTSNLIKASRLQITEISGAWEEIFFILMISEEVVQEMLTVEELHFILQVWKCCGT